MRLFLIFLFISFSVFSQTAIVDNEKVIISEAHYKVKVAGPFTTVDAYFSIENLENFTNKADFLLKVPDDSYITSYALDINGKMRNASAAGKDEARIAFESEMRRRVDPGLVEWNQGNIFKTKVYPIPPGGVRKIRISYILPYQIRHTLKLNHSVLKSFSFNLEAQNIKTFKFPKNLMKLSNERGTYFEIRAQNQKVGGDFTFTTDNPYEKLYFEENLDGNIYWFYRDKINFKSSRKIINLKTISIFQDVSLSRNTADLEKELQYIEKLWEMAGKPAEIKLFQFSISSNFVEKFQINSRTEFKAFKEKYLNCTLDGGTDYSALATSVKLNNADLKIVFSDGLNNFTDFADKAELIAVNSSPDFDKYSLTNFGLNFINLNSLSVNRALHKTLFTSPTFKFATEDSFAKISNGELTACGLLRKGQTSSFSVLNDKEIVFQTSVNPVKLNQSDYIRNYWSQQKLNALMRKPLENKEKIIEFGKSHSLVTPYTSLIVFESLWQYLEYEIRPPDSEPVLQAEYDKEYKPRKKPKVDLTIIRKKWKEYKGWWDSQQKKKVKTEKHDAEHLTKIDQEIARQQSGQNNTVKIKTVKKDKPKKTVKTPDGKEKIISFLDTLEISEEQRKALDSKINNFYEHYDLKNFEIDMLKNESGRLNAENKRLSSQLTELKELYVKDRSATSRRRHSPHSGEVVFTKHTTNSKFYKTLADNDKPYETYLELREKHGSTPAFYFECAEYFIAKDQKDKALLILSNIPEIAFKNAVFLRMTAYRLEDLGFLDLSIKLLREVKFNRPEEAHSSRDLARVLFKKAKEIKDPVDKDIVLSESLRLYKHTIENTFPGWGFRNFSTTLIEEYHNMCLLSGKPFQLNPAFKHNLDMDLRVVISWDSDMVDLDLHIFEPGGEEVYYSNRNSKNGGRLSVDYTRGLGPETYCIRYAPKGKFKVAGKIYRADALFFTGHISVKLDIYRNYGRPNQSHKSTTVKLDKVNELIDLATIELK